MIIDGTKIAKDVCTRTKARANALPRAPRVLALAANDTAATRSYLAMKKRRADDAGCVLEVLQFPQTVSERELIAAMVASDADALLVQLPLPGSIDVQVVCNAIPFDKDADVLSSAARDAFARGEAGALVPPVVGAIAEVFERYDILPKGKRAVVVGSGFLVGAPAAAWLVEQGAETIVVTIETPVAERNAALREADIIVSGAGTPRLITPDLIRDGVVLVDAGTSELGGEIVGDVDPACAKKCALFTPVPGGLGPLAVAKLFENAVFLAERKVSFS